MDSSLVLPFGQNVALRVRLNRLDMPSSRPLSSAGGRSGEPRGAVLAGAPDAPGACLVLFDRPAILLVLIPVASPAADPPSTLLIRLVCNHKLGSAGKVFDGDGTSVG